MIAKVKRQQRTVDSIVKIPLEEGYHAYARVLKTKFAFYDFRTKEEVEDLQEIISSPILFITAVNNYAITRGLWVKVGKVLPTDYPVKLPPQFVQDPLKPNSFYIVENGIRRPSSLEEVQGLECVAVWTPEAIQERLNDHYAGRKNYSVESMLHPELSHEEIKKRIAKSQS